jgi:hypothetical protein
MLELIKFKDRPKTVVDALVTGEYQASSYRIARPGSKYPVILRRPALWFPVSQSFTVINENTAGCWFRPLHFDTRIRPAGQKLFCAPWNMLQVKAASLTRGSGLSGSR